MRKTTGPFAGGTKTRPKQKNRAGEGPPCFSMGKTAGTSEGCAGCFRLGRTRFRLGRTRFRFGRTRFCLCRRTGTVIIRLSDRNQQERRLRHACCRRRHGTPPAHYPAGGGQGRRNKNRRDRPGLSKSGGPGRGAEAGHHRALLPPRADVRGLLSPVPRGECPGRHGPVPGKTAPFSGPLRRGLCVRAGEPGQGGGIPRRDPGGAEGGAGPRHDDPAVLCKPILAGLPAGPGGPVRPASGGPLPAGAADPENRGEAGPPGADRRQRGPVPQAAAGGALRLRPGGAGIRRADHGPDGPGCLRRAAGL